MSERERRNCYFQKAFLNVMTNLKFQKSPYPWCLFLADCEEKNGLKATGSLKGIFHNCSFQFSSARASDAGQHSQLHTTYPAKPHLRWHGSQQQLWPSPFLLQHLLCSLFSLHCFLRAGIGFLPPSFCVHILITITKWDSSPTYKWNRGSQSQLLAVIAPFESDPEGHLESFTSLPWEEIHAMSQAGSWKKVKKCGALSEKVSVHRRLWKPDVIRTSEAWGVGWRWRRQCHESRWPIHFEVEHQPVGRILGTRLVFQQMKMKSSSDASLALIHNTGEPQEGKKEWLQVRKPRQHWGDGLQRDGCGVPRAHPCHRHSGLREARLRPESNHGKTETTDNRPAWVRNCSATGRAALPEKRWSELQPEMQMKEGLDYEDSSKHGKLGFLPRIAK